MEYTIVKLGKNVMTKHIDSFGKIWMQKMFFKSFTPNRPNLEGNTEEIAKTLQGKSCVIGKEVTLIK